MYEIKVPISVEVNKKGKRWYLNLNQYRNTHFHTLNKAKAVFHEEIKPLLGLLPKMTAVRLTYTLFPGTNQLCDTANICCIVDKFFSDVLVEAGIIEDDNFRIVLSSDYRYGRVIKGQPHCKVTLEPVPNLLT